MGTYGRTGTARLTGQLPLLHGIIRSYSSTITPNARDTLTASKPGYQEESYQENPDFCLRNSLEEARFGAGEKARQPASGGGQPLVFSITRCT